MREYIAIDVDRGGKIVRTGDHWQPKSHGPLGEAYAYACRVCNLGIIWSCRLTAEQARDFVTTPQGTYFAHWEHDQLYTCPTRLASCSAFTGVAAPKGTK